jgi:hypothetical protein
MRAFTKHQAAIAVKHLAPISFRRHERVFGSVVATPTSSDHGCTPRALEVAEVDLSAVHAADGVPRADSVGFDRFLYADRSRMVAACLA